MRIDPGDMIQDINTLCILAPVWISGGSCIHGESTGIDQVYPVFRCV